MRDGARDGARCDRRDGWSDRQWTWACRETAPRLAGAQPGCPEPSDDEAAEMQVINDLQKYCRTLMNMEGQSSHIYGAAEATLDWLEAKHRQLESFINT